jgi:hypothetical protein
MVTWAVGHATEADFRNFQLAKLACFHGAGSLIVAVLRGLRRGCADGERIRYEYRRACFQEIAAAG